MLVKKGSVIKLVKDLNKLGIKVFGVIGVNFVENIKKVVFKVKVLELFDYV